MGRAIKGVFLVPKNLLRAIAVMHVEINDGHALGAIRRHGVTRRDAALLKKQKTHRRAGQGVMAGRPRRDEAFLAARA